MTEPPITEPSPAPEVLVDGFCSAMVANGVAKLALFTLRADSAGQNERAIVLRLNVPVVALIGIHEALGRVLGDIEQQAKRHGQDA